MVTSFCVRIGFLFSASLVFCSLYVSLRNYCFSNGKLGIHETWKGDPIEANVNWTGSENLVWFVQVTDLHINKYGPKERINDFEEFCTHYISELIKPKAVFVTGDIVDSKINFFKSTGLIEEECKTYHDILNRTKVYQKTLWRDIRGNHDASQVFGVDHRCYTIGRPAGLNQLGRSFQLVVNESFGTYNFLGLDLAPIPGLILPMNFFGTISDNAQAWATDMAEKVSTYNHTIWLSHYPISFLRHGNETRFMRQVMRNSIGYIFGHLHINKYLYVRDPDSDTLLLELGDWRNNRRFRIFAYDNDLFMFRDYKYKHGESVLILITNPKDSRYLVHKREPTLRIVRSTHVRALVFSNVHVHKLIFYIDNKYHCSYVDSSNKNDGVFDGRVFFCPWDPTKLDQSKLHKIKLLVITKDNNFYTDEHEFSFQNTYQPFSTLYCFLMLFNMAEFVKYLYLFIVYFLFIIPLWVQILPRNVFSKIILRFADACFPTLARYFFNLSNYLPLMMFSFICWMYPMGCPLEYVPNTYGHGTLFGVFLDGRIYYEPVIYIFYIQKMIVFNIPMYLHYYFRLKLLSLYTYKHVLALRLFYHLLCEMFWLLALLISSVVTFYRVCPTQGERLPIHNIHLYFPVVALYLRLHPISYTKKRHV